MGVAQIGGQRIEKKGQIADAKQSVIADFLAAKPEDHTAIQRKAKPFQQVLAELFKKMDPAGGRGHFR